MVSRSGLAIILAGVVALAGCGRKIPSLPLTESEKSQVAQAYRDGPKQTFTSNGHKKSQVYYQDFCVGGATVDVLFAESDCLEIGNMNGGEVIFFKKGKLYAVHASRDGSVYAGGGVSCKEFSEDELMSVRGFGDRVLEEVIEYQKTQ